MQERIQEAKIAFERAKYAEFFRIMDELAVNLADSEILNLLAILKSKFYSNEKKKSTLDSRDYGKVFNQLLEECMGLLDKVQSVLSIKPEKTIGELKEIAINTDFLVLYENQADEKSLFSKYIKAKPINTDAKSSPIVLYAEDRFYKLIIIQGNHQEGKTTVCKEIERTTQAEYLDLNEVDLPKLYRDPRSYFSTTKGVWIIDNFDLALDFFDEGDSVSFLGRIKAKHFLDEELQIILTTKYHEIIDQFSTIFPHVLNTRIKLLSDSQQLNFIQDLNGGNKFIELKKIGTLEPIKNIFGIPSVLQRSLDILDEDSEFSESTLVKIYDEFYSTIFLASNSQKNIRKSFIEWFAFKSFVERYNAKFSFESDNAFPSINLLFTEWMTKYGSKDSKSIKIRGVQLIRELYYFFQININQGTFTWRELSQYFLAKYFLRRELKNVGEKEYKFLMWGLLCILDSEKYDEEMEFIVKDQTVFSNLKACFFQFLKEGWLFKDYSNYIEGTLMNHQNSKFFIPPILGYFRFWNILKESSKEKENASIINADIRLKDSLIFLLNSRDIAVNKNVHENGEKNYFPIDLSFIDFSHANLGLSCLIDSDFIESNLLGTNFTNSDLKGAYFEKTEIDCSTIFTSSNLLGAVFERVTIAPDLESDRRASFQNTELGDFISVNFQGVDFIGANFNQSKLTDSQFIDCNFHESKFFEVEISNSNFVNADFSASTFSQKQQFKGVLLKESDFKKSILNNLDFTQTTIESASFDYCQLKDAIFSGMKIANKKSAISEENVNASKFPLCTSFKGADLTYADLKEAIFINVDFSECLFDSTKLGGAKFEDCNFERAIFICNLSEVEFINSPLSKSKIFNITHDDSLSLKKRKLKTKSLQKHSFGIRFRAKSSANSRFKQR